MFGLKLMIQSSLMLVNYAREIRGDIIPMPPTVGGQMDYNNCLIGAGYSWCESSHNCVRKWETPCGDDFIDFIDCPDCLNRQKNGENIACPVECDTVNLNCNVDNDCSNSHFCRVSTMDNTGPKECVPFSSIGESCGGYTLPSEQMRCSQDMECVNIEGPMIADAPGNCMVLCNSYSVRDPHGNCNQLRDSMGPRPIPTIDPMDPIHPIDPLPPASICPDVMCMMYCENDFQKDENDCNMCLCNEIHNPECPIPYVSCSDKVCPKVIEMTHCSEGGISGYTTYQLSLVINENIDNIYAIFGSQEEGHLALACTGSRWRCDELLEEQLLGIVLPREMT